MLSEWLKRLLKILRRWEVGREVRFVEVLEVSEGAGDADRETLKSIYFDCFFRKVKLWSWFPTIDCSVIIG